jgi:hypothetical protein
MAKKSNLMAAVQAANAEKPNVASTRGKKSDPRFRQISILVEREPYDELRRRVIGTNRDASDIFNELLKGWLKT